MDRTDIVITDVARVSVNHVEVGSIPLQQFLDMKKEAKRDWKLYLSQTLNYLYTVYRIAISIIQNIPMVWFAVAFLMALFDQQSITTIIEIVQSSNAEQIKDGFIYILGLSTVLSSIATSASIILTRGLTKYGFINKFDRSVANRLMKLLEVPTIGEIQVTYIKKN